MLAEREAARQLLRVIDRPKRLTRVLDNTPANNNAAERPLTEAQLALVNWIVDRRFDEWLRSRR